MRRIKLILAVVAAVAVMTVLAAPAMAQTFTPGTIEIEGANDFGDITVVGDAGLLLGDDILVADFGDDDVFDLDDVLDDGSGSIQFVVTDDPDSFDSVSFA